MTQYGTEWPPTLADIKAYLKIDDDNAIRDALIQLASDASKSRVERYCQRQFETATRTYYENGNRTVLLPLPDYPIGDITSISINSDVPRVWTAAIDSDFYQVINNGSNEGEDKYAIHRIDGGVWDMGIGNIKVIADTGYTEGSIPDDLYFAAVELTAHIYMRAENKRIGLVTRSEQGGSVGYDMERAAIPLAIKDMLDPFRSARAFGV